MSSGVPFRRYFSSVDSSLYRERQEEEWSPRSPESEQDSDEENHESNVITITDSSTSSLESPLTWAKTSSFSNSSPSTSLVLYSQGSKDCQEGGYPTDSSKEFFPKSSSLVIGKRPRAVGLKDIDLTRNPAAKHIRETKAANKSPKKKHLFSPLSRHMSCPTFSSPNEIFSLGPSGRHEKTGKTGQTGLNRELKFDSDSQLRSAVVCKSSAVEVTRKSSLNAITLFSCPNDGNFDTTDNMLRFPEKKSDCDWCDTATLNVVHNSKLSLAPEVIDLTSSEEPSGCKINSYNKQSDCRERSEKNGDVSNPSTALRNRLPLKGKMARKKSEFSFSDDDDSDSAEWLAKSGNKTSQQPDSMNELSQNKPCSKRWLLKMCLIFGLCALSLSVYFHVNPHGLCLDSEFSKNISGIGSTLKTELYGQHIAQKLVTSALKNHFNKQVVRKPLVLSFHGWTGIGKNFVSNIITEHLFKRKTHSPFVHKFIIPLHFPHESEVENYNVQLQRWVKGNISQCSKGGLFIFDEMDKIHHGMMDTIKDAILDYRGKKAVHGNVVFIFLSNSGGEAINRHVLNHVLEGKLRESLTLSELEIIFHGIVKRVQDVWFADLLKSEVIDHLVPFLPLERTHIKQCIRRDLIKKGFQVKEALVTEIADQMEYFPERYEFFSVSGCKKVSSRVDVVMG